LGLRSCASASSATSPCLLKVYHFPALPPGATPIFRDVIINHAIPLRKASSVTTTRRPISLHGVLVNLNSLSNSNGCSFCTSTDFVLAISPRICRPAVRTVRRSVYSSSPDYNYSWHVVVAWNVLLAFFTGCDSDGTTFFAVLLVEFRRGSHGVIDNMTIQANLRCIVPTHKLRRPNEIG
jgi:hypothetical protein